MILKGVFMAENILVVEDDVSIAELVRDYLQINQMQTDLAETGPEGLEKALKGSFDLILLDLMLPGMDGFEVLRKIREVKETPVLLVSARREDIDKIRGLGLGADDYITKPFSPSELVARVKAHLSRYKRLTGQNHPRENNIHIRGLDIDPDAHSVTSEGQNVQLTSKEFELLLLLARNPNRVFSKDQLFDRIWGMDALGDVATVTVHIGKLREKIEPDVKNPQYIETVWGAGYRFRM
jgi:DNA-binding response OmpR family regulator